MWIVSDDDGRVLGEKLELISKTVFGGAFSCGIFKISPGNKTLYGTFDFAQMLTCAPAELWPDEYRYLRDDLIAFLVAHRT